MNRISFHLFLLATLMICSGLAWSQQDLYKWRIGGGTGNIHVGGSLEGSGGDEIVSFNPNFLAWSLSAEYLLSESIGLGLSMLSETSGSDLKDAGFYFRYYTDNRFLFGRRALIAPFFNLGVTSNKKGNNFALPLGAGLKFRIWQRLNLNLSYSAMLYSDQWSDIANSFKSDYASYTAVSIHYNFAKKKHHFKAPKIYSSSRYNYLQEIVLPVIQDTISVHRINGNNIIELQSNDNVDSLYLSLATAETDTVLFVVQMDNLDTLKVVDKPLNLTTNFELTDSVLIATAAQDSAITWVNVEDILTDTIEQLLKETLPLDSLHPITENLGVALSEDVPTDSVLQYVIYQDSAQALIQDTIHIEYIAGSPIIDSSYVLSDSLALGLSKAGESGDLQNIALLSISMDTISYYGSELQLPDTNLILTQSEFNLLQDTVGEKTAPISTYTKFDPTPGSDGSISSFQKVATSVGQPKTEIESLEYDIKKQKLENELTRLKYLSQNPQYLQQMEDSDNNLATEKSAFYEEKSRYLESQTGQTTVRSSGPANSNSDTRAARPEAFPSSSDVGQQPVIISDRSKGPTPFLGLNLGLNQSGKKASQKEKSSPEANDYARDSTSVDALIITEINDSIDLALISKDSLSITAPFNQYENEYGYYKDSLAYLLVVFNELLIKMQNQNTSESKVAPVPKTTQVEMVEVFFKTNSTSLSQLATGTLNDLLTATSNKTISCIDIAGYADPTGNPEQNLLLSKKRANTVRAYLVQQEIDTNLINMHYKGADLNLKPGQEAYGRRVQVIVTL